MSQPAPRSLIPNTELEQLRDGRAIVKQEAAALTQLADRLDAAFCKAVDLILECQGSVIVSGMGKAGLIGQKLTATFSSTGTRAHFLHPAEAVHGDLGCLRSGDLFLALSNSGETGELNQILPTLRRMSIPIVAITSSNQNTLAEAADVVIQIGRLKEACEWGLAPSTSTTTMLAAGDALALVASRQRQFTPQQFAEFHPAGSLGRKLKPIADVMRPVGQIRIAVESATVRNVFTSQSLPGRRTGAVLLVNDSKELSGLFTDSDLARLLERRQDAVLDQPISSVMTHNPVTAPDNATLAEVIDLLSERKISELPIVDEAYRPVGLVDITDVIGWTPSGKTA